MHNAIITQTVLNTETGEFHSQDLKLIPRKSKLKGGFRMVYSKYDEAVVKVIRSSIDYNIVVAIREQFTYNKPITNIPSKKLAEVLGISDRKIRDVINRMVEEEMLMRIEKGIYRFNPFMYIPYRSDGVELQKEWLNLKDNKNT